MTYYEKNKHVRLNYQKQYYQEKQGRHQKIYKRVLRVKQEYNETKTKRQLTN